MRSWEPVSRLPPPDWAIWTRLTAVVWFHIAAPIWRTVPAVPVPSRWTLSNWTDLNQAVDAYPKTSIVTTPNQLAGAVAPGIRPVWAAPTSDVDPVAELDVPANVERT